MRGQLFGLFTFAVVVALGSSRVECQPAPAFMEAASSWQRCLADAIKPRVQSSDSAQTLADLALSQCKLAQDNAIAVGEKYHGASGRQAILNYIQTFRAQLPEMLSNARSGRASDKLNERWGQCVAATAMADATKSGDPPEVIADRAFTSCRDLENQTFDEFKKGSDEDASERNFAIVRRTIRNQVIQAVKAAHPQKG